MIHHPGTTVHPSDKSRSSNSGRTTKWLVIAFAVVEAIVIGWLLFSGKMR